MSDSTPLAGKISDAMNALRDESDRGRAELSTVETYVDTIRADLRADKVGVITATMQFSEKDAAAFWPIYKRYEFEVAKLNDERIQAIKRYAQQWNTMTDADAKAMALRSFDLESRRTELKKKYFAEFSQALPGVVVMKFFQLEHRMDLLVNLRIASELPTLLLRS